MHITIDENAGFCGGVKRTVKMAEDELSKSGNLYCLGQIVHNEEEEQRLKALGLKVIDHDEFRNLHNAKVLIRSHGEPPETYQIAKQNNIKLIEGSCPVVLNLQKKIKKSFEQGVPENAQVVIYGKPNHPEVIGLNGQIENKAVLVENVDDLHKIDFKKPLYLFAQTTKNKEVYREIIQKIASQKKTIDPDAEIQFESHNSICKQVSNRDEGLRLFARNNDLIIFVGGEKSSNGKYLFSVCKSENPNAFYVGSPEMIKAKWFNKNIKVGVTGATSTPKWLLERVASKIYELTR